MLISFISNLNPTHLSLLFRLLKDTDPVISLLRLCYLILFRFFAICKVKYRLLNLFGKCFKLLPFLLLFLVKCISKENLLKNTKTLSLDQFGYKRTRCWFCLRLAFIKTVLKYFWNCFLWTLKVFHSYLICSLQNIPINKHLRAFYQSSGLAFYRESLWRGLFCPIHYHLKTIAFKLCW